MPRLFNLFRRNEMSSQEPRTSQTAVINELDDITSRISGWATAEHNEDGTHNLNYATNPRVTAYQATVQTFTNGVFASITYDTEEFKVGAVHSTTVNTSRFVATRAGLWFFQAGIQFTANANGQRIIRVLKNGAGLLPTAIAVSGSQTGVAVNSGANNTTMSTPTIVIPLVQGDYLEAIGFQDSGGNLNSVVATPNVYFNSYARFFLLFPTS